MQNLLLILFAGLSLIALVASLILMRGLFPAQVTRVRQTLEANWKLSFWIGLGNTVLITLIIMGLGSLSEGTPIFFILAFGLYGAFLVGLLYGLSALARVLGERLFPDQTSVKQDIKGGAVFVLASLLPGVGWFILFPYGISLAVGGALITLFHAINKRDSMAEEG